MTPSFLRVYSPSFVILFTFLSQFLISSSFAFLHSKVFAFSSKFFWCSSPYLKSHLRIRISVRDGVGEELKEMKTIRKNHPVAALQINDIISVIQNEFHSKSNQIQPHYSTGLSSDKMSLTKSYKALMTRGNLVAFAGGATNIFVPACQNGPQMIQRFRTPQQLSLG